MNKLSKESLQELITIVENHSHPDKPVTLSQEAGIIGVSFMHKTLGDIRELRINNEEGIFRITRNGSRGDSLMILPEFAIDVAHWIQLNC